MDKISADLAGKVLTANQRNIVAKVSAGKTLSGPELKIFEEVLAQQNELRNRRQAALIRRYCEGGRLTAEERGEIIDLIPHSQDDPPTAPAPVNFAHTREHYAAMFKQTARTINRWIAHGRERGELPPLDEPSAMSAWWTRHMKHRVPAELLAFKPAAPIAVPLRSESVTGDTPAGSPVIPEAMGMSGMLKRMREAERDAAAMYVLAQQADPPDPSLIEMRRRAWEKMAETLRKLEKDSPGILTASGDVLDRETTIEVVAQLHGVIALTWRSFARRMLPALRGLSIEQGDKLWNSETDRVFEKFIETRFAAPVELGSAA